MTRCLVLVIVTVAAAAALVLAGDNENYVGYRLVSATVSEDRQLAVVRSLATGRRDLGVDLLAVHTDDRHKRATLLVPPHAIDDVLQLLKAKHVPNMVVWDDVQRALDLQAVQLTVGPRDVQLEGKFTDADFMRYEEVEQYLHRLAAEYPDMVTLQTLGRTHEGRELLGVRLSTAAAKESGPRRPAILLDAGFHAREWIAPPVALYAIHQLVEDEGNRYLLDGLDWYIFPLLNPDGYEYSHTKSRFWRKNRSVTGGDPYCRGVDLNRNFDFHWAESGSSHAACDITFAGPYAFSELETKQYRDFILDKNANKTITMYLTLHSYGRLILYPWGYSDEVPKDADRLHAIGEEANQAMVKAGSKKYRVGSAPSLLYPASGGSDDWAKAVAGIEAAYTLELPGGGPNGFDIGKDKIAKTVRHVFEGIKVFAKHAKESAF